MNWLYELFFGSGIAHTVAVFSVVIALGVLLGKIKVRGVSLGITWVLFAGIFLSHIGMRIEPSILGFVKEFGLILFVYSIGMQVGPGFFSAFKRGGLRLNMFAILIVALGVLTTLCIFWATGTPITTMVGILSGAVTNTPGLGAAQQAVEDMGGDDPTIAMGYAVAYPLGVIGIILVYMLLRAVFRVDYDKEAEAAQNRAAEKMARATHVSMQVNNPAIFGKTIREISHLVGKKFVASRVLHADGTVEIGESDTVLGEGDRLLVIAARQDMEAIAAFIGSRVEEMHRADWQKLDEQLVSRRIMVTRSELNGRLLGELHVQRAYGVNITRVNRAGLDLVAHPALALQVGDRVTVVGPEQNIAGVEKLLGNSMRRLREPNLITIFVGIFLGVALGSIPFVFPGVPQPVKLGLAGGPLIVAILVSRFGPSFKLVTYTTASANLMLREVGIALFLAAVGLGAGEDFVATVVDGGGLIWVWYGFLITVIPLCVAGVIARLAFRMNYFTLLGLIAGATTDPPALAFSNEQTPTDLPAVAYSTVYPLVMFLRVLSAQLLVIFLA